MASNPRTLIVRFTARRSLSGSLGWGLLFGVLVLSSAIGFITAFSTPQAREQLAIGFGSNVGLKAVLGVPHAIQTVAGFTEWRTLGVIMLMGAIWGLLSSTGAFRGEEESGRWELLLSGITSQRRGVAQALLGTVIGLAVLYFLESAIVLAVSSRSDIAFGVGRSLLFSFSLMLSPLLFMAVGAFTSQLASSRRQAMGMGAAFFGLSFFLRALADSTSGNDWLRNVSPFGWMEQLQPLTNPHPLWLIPIGLLIAAFAGGAIWLAGRRDLGEGLVKENDSPRSSTRFLGSSTGLAVRLTQGSRLGWWLTCFGIAAAFGGVAKSAAQSLADSQAVQSFITHLTASISDSASAFLGLIFTMIMVVVMIMTAGAIGGIREEEATGHLDNLLVRPVSRFGWLAGRWAMALLAIAGAGLAIGLGTWLTVQSQGLDISGKTLLEAGLNAAVPGAFLLGLGTLVLGGAPRIATFVCYAVIAESFLIQFVASALNMPNWVLDLSVLNHMALSPAVAPDWHTTWIMLSISLALSLAGAWLFSRRDIAPE